MIKKFITTNFLITRKIEYRPLCRAYYLLYNGQQAQTILKETYKYGVLKLDRKYEVYLKEFKDWIPRARIKPV